MIFILEQQIKQYIPKIDSITRISQGGQKVVYTAKHVNYGDIVLKFIKEPGFDPRIAREIEILKAYSFPHVPKLFDHGSVTHNNDNIVYLIEQYIAGETLHARLQQGPLPLNNCLYLLKSLLDTVVELEKVKLVHRDIKPENIIIGGDEEIWLLDFGIARDMKQSSITTTGLHFGPHTAGYAAPEQFRNLKKEIDSRTDLFSIGVVMYEALIGKHPFIEGARDYLDILRRTEVYKVPILIIPGDSQRQLGGFIDVLMAKYPSRRPINAQTALDWFNALLSTINP